MDYLPESNFKRKMNVTANTNQWAAHWSTDDGVQLTDYCSKIYFGRVENMCFSRAIQQKLRVGESHKAGIFADSDNKVGGLT